MKIKEELKGIQEERERILKIIDDVSSYKVDGLKNSIPFILNDIKQKIKGETKTIK